MNPGWQLERAFWQHGLLRVAGVDEAGRGAWAGPLSVAAVILPAEERTLPYRDSKTLSERRRAELAEHVKASALAWHVEFASAEEIDRLGVLRATRAAALRALAALVISPEALITDYLRLDSPLPQVSPPKADRDSYTVAAASLLAKVARDTHMQALEARYPGYGFAAHKGYGTAEHRRALEALGISAEHRRSFAPVAQVRLL
ncbi:ribonuclease HII [Deinobacterium chartae]|uniref:Ribonuclease HII n=1 Tax=Deinobacterium chartae TaxID=521158 RepID=A0A841HZQ4_9DEIO|nr:ribonuclease HII [Deinobacterium chartae]